MACWFWHVIAEDLDQACLEWLWVFYYAPERIPRS